MDMYFYRFGTEELILRQQNGQNWCPPAADDEVMLWDRRYRVIYRVYDFENSRLKLYVTFVPDSV